MATKFRLTYIKGKMLKCVIHCLRLFHLRSLPADHVLQSASAAQATYDRDDQWDTCFELNAELPREDLYLGFSALTGDVSDAHE